MRTVRDAEGTTYLLLDDGGESSVVHDPSTGEERTLPCDALEAADGEAPLIAAARVLPEPTDPPLSSVVDLRALGLLVHLEASGPRPVTTLLDIDALCESDLHGIAGELRAADLIAETTVDGRRGYRLTEAAEAALGRLRD